MTVNIVLRVNRNVLLASCSNAFQYLLCFMHGQGQQTKEIENKKHVTKKLASLVTSFALIIHLIHEAWNEHGVEAF